MSENIVIIGSGPAAHTAAIYAARARLEPLLYEGLMAGGVAAGGQLTTTTEVENYPGFPTGIMGPALMDQMRQQSVTCGTRIKTQTVQKVDFQSKPFKIFADSETVESKAVIIATGATAKRLHVPGEDRLWQKGISACAVCDGALPIFRNKTLLVVGGGDSAVEESTYLTKFASKVLLLVRRDALRASKAMQERLLANKKIEVIWNTVLLEVLGDRMITGARVKNVKTNQESTLEAEGLFYAIGHQPNTAFLDGQVELDETGYIKTQPGSTRTSIPGVFACGDVQDKTYRQAVTAAGTGCMAALDAERYLSGH
ncbi:MAG: thioredoxin-disulfide reductase [Candidatus Omnitrophota bacterium]|nr:thioredoxin-disulfide reductase [Candidatus Omnitrophota bacterium]MDZ4241985.1 thioredoxin-disulfide reductase [Candidatus Omnitrophota bacterium]